MNQASTKRERLTAAAAVLVHQKGFANTTLADIANQANMPLGGIYYYFKTKHELAKAISDKRLGDINTLLGRFDQLPEPFARLKALVNVWVDDREIDARFGCPVGSLCYEFAKGRGPLSSAASQLFITLLQWTGKQFIEAGFAKKRSEALALHLISALQGISLIANALGDPDSILMETKFLKEWLEHIRCT